MKQFSVLCKKYDVKLCLQTNWLRSVVFDTLQVNSKRFDLKYESIWKLRFVLVPKAYRDLILNYSKCFCVSKCMYCFIKKNKKEKPCQLLKLMHLVSRAVEWLEGHDDDRHNLGLKPTRAIPLCPWDGHFTTISPAWRSWKAVLYFSHISIYFYKNKKIKKI